MSTKSDKTAEQLDIGQTKYCTTHCSFCTSSHSLFFIFYYFFIIFICHQYYMKVITFDIYGMAGDPSKPYWAFQRRSPIQKFNNISKLQL